MNPRALDIAVYLVESGLYLREPAAYSVIDGYIADAATASEKVVNASIALERLVGEREDIRAAAFALSTEYARAAYQLGIYVGLQVAPCGDPRRGQ